jgi:hypothetical protein
LRKGCAPAEGFKSREKNKIMATYHINVKSGKKGMGAAHAAYIAREEKYSEGKRYEDAEFSAAGNMPKWAEHKPNIFWKAADEYERENGAVYRELEVALPREFTPEQRLKLVQDFIQQEIGEKHAYQFAIHNPKAALEKGEQPHAHIMYSERTLDSIDRDPEQYFKRYNAKHPEKGGNKKASGGKLDKERKEELAALRERWANVQNKHLEKNGSPDRVDHRSLKEQGIDREPEKRLGGEGVRNATAADKKALLELRNANRENLQAAAEAAPIVEQVQKQSNARDLAANAAEKFKAKLAERAELAAKAERDQRRADRDKFLADHAKAKADLLKQEQAAAAQIVEQQRREQVERDKAAAIQAAEQQRRDKATAEQQKREPVERDPEAADKRIQEQAAAKKAERLAARDRDKGMER